MLRRHQYLSTHRLRGYPRRQYHAFAEEVLALLDSFIGMESDADPNGLAGVLGVVNGRNVDTVFSLTSVRTSGRVVD